VRKRLVIDPDALLFCGRGAARWRRTTSVADCATWWTRPAWPTPRHFRRIRATAINNAGGIDLVAELLWHTNLWITAQHCIVRDDLVNPATVRMLEERRGGM